MSWIFVYSNLCTLFNIMNVLPINTILLLILLCYMSIIVVQPAYVSFPGDGIPIIPANTFQGDPYGRFEASIEVLLQDMESVLDADSFVWEYKLENNNDEWTDIAYRDNNDITVYNKQVSSNSNNVNTLYQSSLIIQSIRRLNAGYCYDEDDNSRIFKPGNVYELRFKLLDFPSNILLIETSALPEGGVCVVVDEGYYDVQNTDPGYIAQLYPLQGFHILCMDWRNDANLEYNALFKNTIMSKDGFMDDFTELNGIAPVDEVQITVLIKAKDDNAITCYSMYVTFKSIEDTINDRMHQNPSQNAANIIRDMMDNINTIINNTSLAEHPDVAISIATVIEGIYDYDNSIKHQAAEIINSIVDNIVNKSNSDDTLAAEDIITEISTIASVASNRDIVAHKTTTALVDNYLPHVFEEIDVLITSNKNKTKSQQSVLYVIAQQSQELIKNLESTLATNAKVYDYDDAAFTMSETKDNNNLADALVEFATLAASKALSESNPGESFNFETAQYNKDGSIYNKKTIIATKFKVLDSNMTDLNDSIQAKCGTDQQNVKLPLALMKQDDGIFDCAFMTSSTNNFVSTQNRTQISDTVTVNIYGANRKYESRVNACFPYFITMETDNYNLSEFDEFEPYSFPSCTFWNIDESSWDTKGCLVYNMSNTTVTCGCTHLTTFSLSAAEIVPQADLLANIEDWKSFTIHNFLRYPTVWLTALSFFIVFLIICYINPRSNSIRNRTVLAYEDIIYKSVQNEQLQQDIIGKEIEYLTNYMPNQHMLGLGIQKLASSNKAKCSLCQMQWKLYGAYLRNEHTLLSVFQRSAGTNYSVKQRLGCFFMYVCNIMMVTGIFYGWQQSTTLQDIIASFIISLCGTLPVKIMKGLFQKSKPRVIKSSKHMLNDNEIEVEDHALISSASNGSNHLKSFIKTQDLTLSAFDEELYKMYGKQNQQHVHTIRAISATRKALFDTMFPLAHGCKTIAWIIIIVWSLVSCVVAIVYGFKFDLEAIKVTQQTVYQSNECWNTSLTAQIDHDLSLKKFAYDYAKQQANNASSYAGGDAKSWLLSLLQSLLTSLILWQPLTVYVVTWIKLWMFSWHLKMGLSLRNIWRLCKRCCCGYVDIHSRLVKLGSVNHEAQRRKSRKMRDVVAHKNRPMDVISFLGNEKWIIDDTKSVEVELCIEEEGEEGEEEELQDTTEIMMKDVCNECGLMKIGKIYESDQLFYCVDCWDVYE